MTIECSTDKRRADVRRAHRNGVDGVEAHDDGSTLTVTFLGKAPRHLSPANLRIDGGRRVTDVRVVDIQIEREDDPELDDRMFVTVDRSGDTSTYRLCVVEKDSYGRPGTTPLRGFDPRYHCADFTFKPQCPRDQDCVSAEPCPPVQHEPPVIDYTARDYDTLRRLLLDRMTLTVPDWKERHIPDLGVTAVELLAYVGDELSYHQDAAATEAYLDTARLRVSVRRHVRLIDYAMHDGCNARTWVALTTDRKLTLEQGDWRFVALDVSQVDPKERPELAPVISDETLEELPPGARFEIFEPIVAEALTIRPAHNEIRFYTWGDAECCIPRGATSATLRDCADADDDDGDARLKLKPGDVLIVEEVLGPRTGAPADADPTHRQAVRLVSVSRSVDKLYDQPILDVAWDPEDALTFPVCVSAVGGPECALIENISVARGNVVLADHGRDLTYCGARRETHPVPPAPVPPLDCAPGPYCPDRPERGPAGDLIATLLEQTRAGEPFDEEAYIDLRRLVGQAALDRAAVDFRAPAPEQTDTLETLLAQLSYPSLRSRWRPVLTYAPVTQATLFPSPGWVSAGQAAVLATIDDRARARLERLLRELEDHDHGRHDHGGGRDEDHSEDSDHSDHSDYGRDHRDRHDGDLDDDDVAWLRILFGQAILDELDLAHHPATALRHLIARFDELLAAKLARLARLVARTQGGEVLPASVGWEIAQTWGEALAAGLDPAGERLAGPAAVALRQDPRDALPAVHVKAYDAIGELAGTWLPRRDLLSAGPRDRWFVGELDDDGRLALRFGDGEHGSKPPPGGELKVRYRVGNGTAGNLGADAINHLVLCCGAMDDGVTEVRNPLPATGGTEPEPLDQVRQLAPLSPRRQRLRAVTAADYAELAGRVSGVQRAAAEIRWSGVGQEVHVAIDPLGAGAPDAMLLAKVARFLDAYRRIGHDLIVEPATLVPIDLELLACVASGFQEGHVRAALRRVLGNRRLADGRLGFFHPDALTFGEPVRVSRLVSVAAAVPGVVSVQVTKLRRLFSPEAGELEEGLLRIGGLEVAQLDNDPDRPEAGRLTINLGGGR
ncbi:baseplate J/gp47 family protein [Flindersiella endophytica]